MSRFIKNANLPEKEVTSLISGKMNSIVLDYFKSRGIELFLTRTNPLIDKSVSEHCDMSALHLGSGRIVVDKNQCELIKELHEADIEVIESERAVSGAYPDDIILNQVLIGEYHIGKTDCCDKAVIDGTPQFKRVNTKQGYSKCSCLVVDERSVITDDESIHRKVLEIGLNSLLISKGDVFLDGHDYGFIGGASGKLSDNEVIFFGDITKHSDYDKITSFLNERDIKIIHFDFPLTDFGGIIPLKELRPLI